MQDLTEAFVLALSRRESWDPARVHSDLLPLIEQEGSILQWGRDSGEGWIRILRAGAELSALFWREAPLAIIVPHVSEDLRHYLTVHEVVVIEADDWDAVAYSIDPEAVRAHGAPSFWPLSGSESFESAFSIMDLWWATV